VSKGLPSREQAVELLRKNKCSSEVISHCKAVADLSVEIAVKLQNKGYKVDLNLVEVGALLHDIGRSKTHKVDHGYVGAKIVQSEGLPESVVNIVKRHVGGGITAEEAARFGWPQDVYVPQSLEEKIVSYADKRIESGRRVSIDYEIQRLSLEHKEAAERVRKLHLEITSLLGN
jgi:uncharacterized protein